MKLKKKHFLLSVTLTSEADMDINRKENNCPRSLRHTDNKILINFLAMCKKYILQQD